MMETPFDPLRVAGSDLEWVPASATRSCYDAVASQHEIAWADSQEPHANNSRLEGGTKETSTQPMLEHRLCSRSAFPFRLQVGWGNKFADLSECCRARMEYQIQPAFVG